MMCRVSELNLGADWEQSKRLVVHWHNKWSKAMLERDFVLAYFNPEDTSFREMVHNFMQLSPRDKKAIINLSQSLADLKEGGAG